VYDYQGVDYPSLAAFRTASGNQESNSLQTNPLFTNFASNNFNLQSNSPAIDSAMTLAGINNTTYQGQGPDIGLLEYASGPTCGNYLTESGEQCDDGNTSNGDGCSSSCQIEVAPGDNGGGGGGGGGGGQGGTPPPPVEVEPEVVCGNAIEEEGETCDDGNILNNDGCSYLCQTEEDVETPSTNQIEIPKLQGTLIKTQLDPRVYYINNNNERYYIPNFNTFASWFQNFNSLTVVTPQTLASYPYLGRLTVKPGNLVKFDQDNKVYAVEPTKTLRWISTGNIFQDFGYDFNKIIHLPSEDFQHYTIGEDITNSNVHPTGQLLKHGNFTPIFYIKDSIEYWIKDEATFLSLGFKWQDIITIPVRYWYTRVLDGLQFRLQDR
jgi:cysteine-rich repeat protein